MNNNEEQELFKILKETASLLLELTEKVVKLEEESETLRHRIIQLEHKTGVVRY